MPNIFEWVIIFSLLIILIVSAEFYLTDYRRLRSKIALRIPDNRSPSWSNNQNGFSITQEFEIANTGPEPGIIESVELARVYLYQNDTSSGLSGHSWGNYRHLPDGNRIPPNFEGTLIVHTLLHDWEPSSPEESWTLVVELEITISDQLGNYSIEMDYELEIGH